MREGLPLLSILLTTLLSAQEGKSVYEQKCAQCHPLYIPPATLIENFMEQNNTLLHLKAPTISQIAFRLKTHIGDPQGDKEIYRMEVDSFVADYLMNPDKSKSICLPKVIRYFDTMPSLRGKISVEEIEAVSAFLYDFKSEAYQHQKLQPLAYEKALKVAQKEHKIILIKLTREHCHFCQKMDHEVFEDEEVIQQLNQDFVIVQIDIAKESPPLGLKRGMTPTFIFVDEQEKIMAKIPGAWTKKDFLSILNEAITTQKGAKQ